MDDVEVMDRAFNAYFRNHARNGYTGSAVDQPSNSSSVRRHQGRWYAVVENVRGPLAVFRVQPDGKLRRLNRWPKQVEDY
jgi:hypothetical protein